MTVLRPTGQCFDDALEYLEARVRAHPDLAHRTSLILVHGIARATTDTGEPYAHAWCEEDGHCWDAALVEGSRIYYAVTTVEFYAARQIQETTRYTIREAWLANRRSGHYGPWETKYRALCGRGTRILGIAHARVRRDVD